MRFDVLSSIAAARNSVAQLPSPHCSIIQFTIGQAEGVWSAQALPAAVAGGKQTARIPVEIFCRDMATSADAWRRARASDSRVVEAIARLMQMRPAR